MRTLTIIAGIAAGLLLTNCNKEKRMMKGINGNWNIESSERIIISPDGSENTYESLNNAGKLVVSAGPSETEMNYDFMFIDSNGDTMKSINTLVTDESKTRLIMMGALQDSLGSKNVVWTIEKEKRNKQVWVTYGVDSTLFYPANNMNPGAGESWVKWKITLKREN